MFRKREDELKDKNYEDVLKYNVYDAIAIRALEQKDKVDYYYHIFDIPRNQQLTDYDFVYEHAEVLFYYCSIYYTRNQGAKEKLILFRAITAKYPIEDDYLRYLNGTFDAIDIKWGVFARHLLNFISPDAIFMDEINATSLELLSGERNEIFIYFLKYLGVYDRDKICDVGYPLIEKILKSTSYSVLCKEVSQLIIILQKKIGIKVPVNLMLDNHIIKEISHTCEFDRFHETFLDAIGSQVCVADYLEAHIDYCDAQIEHTEKDGILPCFEEYYRQTGIIYRIKKGASSFLSNEITRKKIASMQFEDFQTNSFIYNQYSTHLLIALFISRHFQASPRMLFEEIKTLYEFACLNNLNLRGMEVYEFIVSFESKSQQEIIDMYNRCKSIPIMEFFYDDWWAAKRIFIDELNEKLFNPENMDPMFEIEGVKCFDISGTKEPIIVHNTSIRIDDDIQITAMIENVKSGKKHYISMSVQDVNHQVFFQDNSAARRKTIKFAYGSLSADRVGIIYHKDAYTFDAEKNDWGICDYKRSLYTLKSLMDRTNSINFNEITYVIDGLPFLPIGVICEDEITKTEVQVAKELNIPILYRQKNKQDDNQYKKTLSIS